MWYPAGRIMYIMRCFQRSFINQTLHIIMRSWYFVKHFFFHFNEGGNVRYKIPVYTNNNISYGPGLIHPRSLPDDVWARTETTTTPLWHMRVQRIRVSSLCYSSGERGPRGTRFGTIRSQEAQNKTALTGNMSFSFLP